MEPNFKEKSKTINQSSPTSVQYQYLMPPQHSSNNNLVLMNPSGDENERNVNATGYGAVNNENDQNQIALDISTTEDSEDSSVIPNNKGSNIKSSLLKASQSNPTVTKPRPKLQRMQSQKVGGSFWDDAAQLKEGTIPQSVVLALTIGIVCGLAAWMYYKSLWFMLNFVWHTLPEKFVIDKWPEHLYVLWIPIVGFTMAFFNGLTARLMGDPGDLPGVIRYVHEKAYVDLKHVLPMVLASQFSILGGGSLGPEAPLVKICAALAGFISRKIFKQRNRNIVRKHTLMGMSGALAAFFGSPLGGSLFGLEVCGRFGCEYFEHMVESIFCGVLCLVVFRMLVGLPMGAIWEITEEKLPNAVPSEVLLGCALGLVGAFLAYIFATTHWTIMGIFEKCGLLRENMAITRSLVGAFFITSIGMFIPHTMFWGEFEFDAISTLSPAETLDHVWPTHGLIGFEMNTWYNCLLVGIFKLLAISITVSAGYRGGFIFPFFSAGAAFARAITILFPNISISITVLCISAGINVAITRTSLATTLILCYLSGEQYAIAPILGASLVSLFVTGYMPFIKSQIIRSDINSALYNTLDDDENIIPDTPELPTRQHRRRHTFFQVA